MSELEQLDIVKPETFEALLKKQRADDKILLIFVSDWAGPCNVFDESVFKASENYGDKCLFIYSDLDMDPTLGIKYDCRAAPSFVLFKGGELVAAGVGAITGRDLWEWITIREQFFDKKV